MSSETSTPISVGPRRHPLAKCEDCELNNEDTTFVPSAGSSPAKVAVVGEAPGYRESKDGVPFTGPSGKLLDMVLEHHEIDRGSVFVTNTCSCRPKGNATPSRNAIKACWPRLKAELNDCSPEYIIALGNTAAQTLLNTREGITTLRSGPPRASSDFEGVSIIPTVHPAACLRSSDMFPSLVTDIGKVVSNGASKWEEPVFAIYDDPTSAVAALKQLRQTYDTVVVDIECGIDKDNDFDHPDRYDMLCIGFAYAPNRAIVIGELACADSAVRLAIKDIVENLRIICQNGMFDLAGLWNDFGHGKLYFDTMLASYCCDERPGVHKLGYLGSEHLGAPDWKDVLSPYLPNKNSSYALVPRDILYRYNAYDCCVTYGLYEYYADRLEKEDLRRLHDFLCEASDELMHIEMEGILIDKEYLDVLTVEYLAYLDELEVALQDIVGRGFNPRSPKQVKEYLASIDIIVASTNEDTLKGLIEKNKAVEFCEQMLKQRREQKLYGTYVKGVRKRLYKGRVYPSLLLHGTVTGRLACRNPNLQNVPRESKIRRLYIPEQGNVFVQGDYAQAELRVMATRSEDKWLKEIFDAGRDLHSEVALRFFGEGFTKDQRVRAKAVVFGLSYGREAFSLAEEFNIPVREAKEYLRTFFEAIPELAQWRDTVRDTILSQNEDLVSTFGRHRRFWLITKENQKDVVKEGLAFLPQADSSDICMSALIRLRRMAHERGDFHVRLSVYDSILVECAEADAGRISRLVQTTMEDTAVDVFGDYVKFKVDMGIGHSWGDLD